MVSNLVLDGQLLIRDGYALVLNGTEFSFKPCFIWSAPYTWDDQVYMSKWEAVSNLVLSGQLLIQHLMAKASEEETLLF